MKILHILHRLPELRRMFGADGLRRRVRYEAERHAGLLARRTPIKTWHDIPDYQGKVGKVFVGVVDTERYRKMLSAIGTDPKTITAEADRVLAGKIRYFSGKPQTTGFPPDWHYHPITKANFPATTHWTGIPDLSPALGDIKMVWEMSRFSFAFPLIRAYAATGDEQYVEGFWRAFEDWCEKNPPNVGPNWRCGQESALRAIAWVFAWSALRSAVATTDARTAALSKALSVTACRIEANLGYALSQRNNHGVSEAVGLWTVSLLLPDHPRARHWQSLGRHHLEDLARKQFAPDGGYIQKSANYQRLALQLYLWAQRLGEANYLPLSQETADHVKRATDLLYQLQDETTGHLPNYGANDGALLFPITEASYEDFRPTLQALAYHQTGKLHYEVGVHDEFAWWFFGDAVLSAPHAAPPRLSLHATSSGYHTLRGNHSFAFLRAASHRTRPGQADNLHVDIWHRGVNIAFDPGSFSYNSPPPWDNGLVHTRVHNTIIMDNADQMTRGGRFLWFDLVTSTVLHHQQGDGWEYIEVAHTAYQHLDPSVRHRRGLLRLGDTYICVDSVEASRPHAWTLNWNLYCVPEIWKKPSQLAEFSGELAGYRIQVLAESTEAEVLEAREGDTLGWRSTRYLQRVPAATLKVSTFARQASWVTIFGHQTAVRTEDCLMVDTHEKQWRMPFYPYSNTYERPLLPIDAEGLK